MATSRRFFARNGIDNNANPITNLGVTGASITLSGANALTFTTSGTTNITLPSGSATMMVTGGALGTPSSGTLTNCTGLPVSTGISGLGTGVATFLATPSSANLLAAVTDETGTGSLVFSTSPTLVTPILGTPTSGTLTNCTGLPISTGVSGLGSGIATFLATPSSANLAAALTDETGSGSVVFSASPTFTGTASFATVSTSGNVTVGGNLIVNGSTETINATVTTLDDPVITLGGDTAPASDDNKDRGVEFRWHNGTTAKVGFFGFDDSTGKFTFIPDATNTSEVFAGALGTVDVGAVHINGSQIAASNLSNGTTGSGSIVLATSPTLTTPTLGVASATSINKVAITAPATSATLTIADGKTLTASNTLTFTGTDSSSVAFGTGGTVVYTSSKLSVHAATTSAELAGVISDETGSGSLVFATSPTLVTPILGTPTSGTLTNCTGLPISTGVSGLGTNVATFLATPTSANLAAAVTDETGSGSLVFATSPTLTTPTLGVATATSVALANGIVRSATLTTSATTANQVVDSISATTYRSAKYEIQVTSGTSYHVTEIRLVHDGTNVDLVEYGTWFTGSSLASFDADINAGILRLLVTPVNAVTTIRVMMQAINI